MKKHEYKIDEDQMDEIIESGEDFLDEDGEFDVDAYLGEDAEELDEDDDEYAAYNEEDSEMAPSSFKGMIAFYRNKENKRHKLNEVPGPIRGMFYKLMISAFLIAGVTITLSIYSNTKEMTYVGVPFALVFVLIALRYYLIGTYQQYVYYTGRVIVSDFYKNQQQFYRTAIKRTLKLDYNCRDFTMQKNDGTKITVTCKSSKDLPEENDIVALLMAKSTQMYYVNSENHVKTNNYISLEKIS